MSQVLPKTPLANAPDKPTVIPTKTAAAARPVRRSPLRTLMGFMPVILAVMVAALYFGVIAADRYVSTASFVVRGADTQQTPDMLGAITGMPAASQSLEDAHILKEYFISTDVIADLRQALPLTEMFRNPAADFLARLPSGSDTLEDLQDYWQKRITVDVDKSTGILTLKASAFTPEDSFALATALLAAGEEQLNAMSDRSRQDTLKIAQAELADSVKTLNKTRARLADFRRQNNMLDPERTADARQGIAEKLESELVAKTVERDEMLTYMKPSAPQVSALNKRIASLRRMIEDEKSKSVQMMVSQAGDSEAQALIDTYHQMEIEREVAERTYIAATEFLETARIDSLRQRRYIAVFSQPHLPEKSTEPNRIYSILTVFVFALLIWGIGQLILATIKEHSQWNL